MERKYMMNEEMKLPYTGEIITQNGICAKTV